ncbi:NOP14 [Bugula neritina]|uniref:NOP14 n=1 Tax=Bugula neritina TaxID=10212 RepID=A0A7J7JD89_BUGNE|nr:NOP14 [Bugula neritina]
MAKTKKVKGKGELSDRIRKRKANRKIETAQTVRTNPFEIKVNRQKHKVIGKHLTKFDKGIPGISRSKAFKKRQDTLLVEYKNKRKSNRLIDHRIGEKDAAASYEEKMFERFALENKRHHQKAGMFNIDDDDDDDDEFELTHKGESLREIEKFERPVESSDEDEGNEHSGNLKGELVTEGHFGGGVLQKTSSETQEKSWKDRMEEMIAKSKLAKQERQSEKEEVGQMTDMLDDQWRQLHNVVTSNKRKNDEEEPTEKDDFDLAVNELRLESTGNPSDRLKTESEMAKIEKEKLEKLEKERLMRMRGEQVKSKKHQSADDLDDGMDYGMDSDNEFEVMYKDGKLVSTKDDDEENEEESDEDEVGSEGESSESEEGGSDEGSDEESEEEDQYSDLDSAGEEVEGSDAEINAPPAKKKKKSEKSSVDDHIPYTFSVPGSYSALIELLDKYSLTDQHTVIERMRKCTHISLAEENKDLLVKLFGFLLEYFGDISLRVPVPMPLLDKLTVHLYELAQQFPKLTAEHSRHVILERQKLFTIYSQSKNGRGCGLSLTS